MGDLYVSVNSISGGYGHSFIEINTNPGIRCFIPDHHIDPRRSALFMARSILREVRDGG